MERQDKQSAPQSGGVSTHVREAERSVTTRCIDRIVCLRAKTSSFDLPVRGALKVTAYGDTTAAAVDLEGCDAAQAGLSSLLRRAAAYLLDVESNESFDVAAVSSTQMRMPRDRDYPWPFIVIMRDLRPHLSRIRSQSR